MSLLLDTDICSLYLKGDRRLYGRFIQNGGQLRISAVSAAELFTWVLRAKASPVRLQGLLVLFANSTFLDLTQAVSRKFGEIRAQQLDQGQPTPEMDLLVAATALVHGLTLVTHNVQDYARVPGLSVVDWLAP